MENGKSVDTVCSLYWKENQKDNVYRLSAEGQVIEKASDVVKNPYVLEFLGLQELPEYSETELEIRIINHLQKFLLELGTGFAFVGRQVRFTFDEEHFKVDLVFYNRLLRCFVLFDLKIGELKHQDIGQMQMYVHYYDRKVKLEDENPTIGIILCKDKNQSIVEMTLPENNNQIFASKYQTVFDYPRLDTLMLAAPVSFAGRLEQYMGRLNRDYEGKTEVIVYDYIDSHIRYFDNMYAKRLRTYKRTGFQLITNAIVSKQNVNAIYDSGNYTDVFERDIIEAEKEIIVSSPELTQEKIERFIYLLKPRQEAGVDVTVITTEPENIAYGRADFCQGLVAQMKSAGINVILKDEVAEHFAIMDEELVWHGGMNLLGREDAWDNLMRIRSAKVSAELLEIAYSISGGR